MLADSSSSGICPTAITTATHSSRLAAVWQQQRHIYESPFYYIDYALAQVCALQFWVRAKSDRDAAWRDYLELCRAGGTRAFTQLVALANLQSPFEERSFTAIIGDINARLDGVPDTHFDKG
ncbi:MAG: hypothetical protein KatS3mg040_1504 [Candidatus Kapaibacterium sp.]|nr:MAG: hypothetical protein KatS3mg040_1504 [Candidatus Kapabacteria bacterium]